MFMIFTLLFTGAAALISLLGPVQSRHFEARQTVPVRGGFIDASGWEGVRSVLEKDGFNLCTVQTSIKSADKPVCSDCGGAERSEKV
jgi:hypothetical protein